MNKKNKVYPIEPTEEELEYIDEMFCNDEDVDDDNNEAFDD